MTSPRNPAPRNKGRRRPWARVAHRSSLTDCRLPAHTTRSGHSDPLHRPGQAQEPRSPGRQDARRDVMHRVFMNPFPCPSPAGMHAAVRQQWCAGLRGQVWALVPTFCCVWCTLLLAQGRSGATEVLTRDIGEPADCLRLRFVCAIIVSLCMCMRHSPQRLASSQGLRSGRPQRGGTTSTQLA